MTAPGRLILGLGLSLALAPVAAMAQSGVDQALARLEAAEIALESADGSLAQRRALGSAIRAYEAALTALGDMNVTLGQQIRSRDRALADGRPALRTRLSALTRLSLVSDWQIALGDGPPDDLLRANLLLERLASETRARQRRVAEDRDALEALGAEHRDAEAALAGTRARLVALRDDLIATAADPQNTPLNAPDISADAEMLAILAVAQDQALDRTRPSPAPRSTAYDLPVDGTLARGFGTPDATGLRRPGLSLSAQAGAVVTAPTDASVRYVGQIDGYGPVVILEPQADTLLILAGLGQTLIAPGATISRGVPLGFLPATGAHEEFSDPPTQETGQSFAKTLYIEVRQDQVAVDPAPWFADLR